MPKDKDSLKYRLTLRIPETLKTDLLDIDPEYTRPVREALVQYLPIKKLMSNPLALPRTIGANGSQINFSVSADGKFQVSIDGRDIEIETDDLKIFMANIYLFTLTPANL
jgi:hypothetical protein